MTTNTNTAAQHPEGTRVLVAAVRGCRPIDLTGVVVESPLRRFTRVLLDSTGRTHTFETTNVRAAS